MKNMIAFCKGGLLIFACLTLFTQCAKEDLNSTSREESFSLDNSINPNASSSNNPGSNNQHSGEGYNSFEENPFISTNEEAISTFSIDADGASYTNVRRFLSSGNLPPKDAVRTEELINFFPLDYPENSSAPISLNGEISTCPWSPGHQLLRIGIKGKEIPKDQLPPSNYVLLFDVSGSMGQPEKLELLKESFSLLVDLIGNDDRMAIVTYSGSSNVILPSTPGSDKQTIKDAINSLSTGGGTNGAQGIITAYEIAEQNFIQGGNNRIIIGTDGDFNIGVSNQEGLIELIEEKRKSGVFLTILGVGTGNLQDGKMEQIANHGNGNYEYIDRPDQAEKVFIREVSKFYTVAKDVKVQIEFNPEKVKEYRLIGYENRLLETEDFEDDAKDAGEIGADQNITALYELVPVAFSPSSGDAVLVDFRYKDPDSEVSQLINLLISDQATPFEFASEDHRFVASVAAYGMLLRNSPYKGNAKWEDAISWTENTLSFDPYGYRAEFLQLLATAKELQ
jgi:Ca-activated chloride channel family protein